MMFYGTPNHFQVLQGSYQEGDDVVTDRLPQVLVLTELQMPQNTGLDLWNTQL